MKTLLLTLVGVVGFTFGSVQAQNIAPSNFPTTLNFQNWSTPVTGYGDLNISSASFNRDSVMDFGPSYRAVRYRTATNGSSPIIMEVTLQENNGQKTLYVGLRDLSISSGESRIAQAMYTGPTWDSLNITNTQSGMLMLPYNFTSSPPATFSTANFVNGWDASGGFPVGGAASSGSGASSSVFVQQAQELNVGLAFQDGQWTVKE